jgi:hypothetical protein
MLFAYCRVLLQLLPMTTRPAPAVRVNARGASSDTPTSRTGAGALPTVR